MPIMQFDLSDVLDGLKLTKEEFIDLCILCGCDYTSTIRGEFAQIRSHQLISCRIQESVRARHTN